MKYLFNRKKGFTLIEISVVVVIIAVLAALAVPAYQKSVEKSKNAEAVTILNKIKSEQSKRAAFNNGEYAGKFSELSPVIQGKKSDSAEIATANFTYHLKGSGANAYAEAVPTGKYEYVVRTDGYESGNLCADGKDAGIVSSLYKGCEEVAVNACVSNPCGAGCPEENSCGCKPEQAVCCNSNQVWDEDKKQCVPSKQECAPCESNKIIVDESKCICDCAAGLKWDADSGKCTVPKQECPPCESNKIIADETSCACACPKGLVWNTSDGGKCIDPDTGECPTCPEGKILLNKYSCLCACPEQTTWSDAENKCVPCPDGTYWSANLWACKAYPACENGKVDPSDSKSCICDYPYDFNYDTGKCETSECMEICDWENGYYPYEMNGKNETECGCTFDACSIPAKENTCDCMYYAVNNICECYDKLVTLSLEEQLAWGVWLEYLKDDGMRCTCPDYAAANESACCRESVYNMIGKSDIPAVCYEGERYERYVKETKTYAGELMSLFNHCHGGYGGPSFAGGGDGPMCGSLTDTKQMCHTIGFGNTCWTVSDYQPHSYIANYFTCTYNNYACREIPAKLKYYDDKGAYLGSK
ncbi:prepilin-type N-terminal cleavage/methylation domain-containing protein [Parelusimicrobium proximum]|uniref:prepilin-type N-terminal cleavage/methylation domain-containing protein n=1 Tax=Parelusimicrobium proximum TaxID=3228953 RepID=UPI003D178E76